MIRALVFAAAVGVMMLASGGLILTLHMTALSEFGRGEITGAFNLLSAIFLAKLWGVLSVKDDQS